MYIGGWEGIYIYIYEGAKLKFREVEKVALKICPLNSHLSFNETCLNIYIYVYLYIHIYMYMYIYP